jgi:hypothetical protein
MRRACEGRLEIPASPPARGSLQEPRVKTLALCVSAVANYTRIIELLVLL